MASHTLTVKTVEVTDLEFFLINKVRVVMKEKNISQVKLSKLAGLSEKHISQMLQGYAGSIKAWDTILDVLDIKLS